MAASLITYADKVSVDPKPNPVNQLWRYLDANEVKRVVNQHAGVIDKNTDDITYINGNIISQTSSETTSFTVNGGDEGTLFICNSGSTINVTLNTLSIGSIPVGSTIYLIRTGDGEVIVDGSNVTVFAQDNGTADQFQIELKFAVIAINHFATDQYIIAGNLLVG